MAKRLAIIEKDSWLEPVEGELDYRHKLYTDALADIETSSGNIVDFANGYRYFGFQRDDKNGGWWFREWLPGAKEVYLFGEVNGWDRTSLPMLKDRRTGVWSIFLHDDQYYLPHGSLYKILVVGDNGTHERVPAYARRAVQDEVTKIFSAQVWAPEQQYVFKNKKFTPKRTPLLIYECHIGMAQEEEKVGTYREFKDKVLPRIAADGYNCIQIMAIQEHPYYGSFGYHVSSFFAASSRFGTPEELKELIDTAHGMGIAVIMDLVHSHAVKNENEGLGLLDGDPAQYFYGDDKRIHSAWDSLCFDYGKNEVVHFLLSNCKYWLEEFKFDGFRFDGVTSMIYYSHGLGEAFCNYGDYYNLGQNGDAICYLTLANRLIHQLNPKAITIAEEVSGMPGLAAPIEDGGYGFDYRMAMNIPDFWIKIIKERKDEDWKPSEIFWELTNRRKDEKTISYAESHDQALVGDKTIIFRLVDADMYWHFNRGDETYMVSRGIALHKMIRLMTLATINGGYLNFMGNEFGHPEWIDFPRLENGWSYKHARRQWSLVDDENLKFGWLNEFDKEMLKFVKENDIMNAEPAWLMNADEEHKTIVFERNNLIFVFNWGSKSIPDYEINVKNTGDYEIVFSSDDKEFGGFENINKEVSFPSEARDGQVFMKIYNVSRTAVVYRVRS